MLSCTGVALAAVLALYAALAVSHLAAFSFELTFGRAHFAAFYNAALLATWMAALVRMAARLHCASLLLAMIWRRRRELLAHLHVGAACARSALGWLAVSCAK